MNKPLTAVLTVGAAAAALFFLTGASPSLTGKAAHALVSEQGALLLDVRTPEEFAQGHVEGARNLPVQELEAQLASLSGKKDQPIVVYCRSGHRSSRAAKILQGAGFTSVHDLGAMSNWQ